MKFEYILYGVAHLKVAHIRDAGSALLLHSDIAEGIWGILCMHTLKNLAEGDQIDMTLCMVAHNLVQDWMGGSCS
jgi:hypothetical protein